LSGSVVNGALAYLRGTTGADRVLPTRGQGRAAVGFLAAVLAFLAVLAIALEMAATRLAADWSGDLAATATLQVYAPDAEIEEQARAALNVLRTTSGVHSVRMLDLAEQERLLEPWLGPDIPIESLPLPLMIEVAADRGALDRDDLALRLQAEAPGAVFDDHAAWREPLVATAGRLRLFALGLIGLVAAAYVAVLALAARGAVAENAPAIRTLRLVGARDGFISRALTRRFLLAATAGAAAGTAIGMLIVGMLPAGSEQGFFLVGIGLAGRSLALPLLVVPVAAVLAWAVTAATTRLGLRRWG
jgi:cell division transport system permease protein